jgi:hypothetical protein
MVGVSLLSGRLLMASKSPIRILSALGSVVLIAAVLSADREPGFRSTEKAFYADASVVSNK